MRPLQVTADDVGLAAGMTRGALAAHDDGIVTACSVAATGEALADAIASLRARPALAVGVHFVLTGARPLSPPGEIPSLVGRDGRLLPSFRAFAWRYLRGGVRLEEIALELRRQAELLRERGLELAHVNAHQHLHLLPRIFTVAAKLGLEVGARRIRLVHEPAPGRSLPRGLEMRVLNRCGARCRRRLPAGLGAPVATVGVARAGHLDTPGLARALESAPPGEGIVELVCHPGLDEATLARRYAWGYCWERETAALRGVAAHAAVERAGFALDRTLAPRA